MRSWGKGRSLALGVVAAFGSSVLALAGCVLPQQSPISLSDPTALVLVTPSSGASSIVPVDLTAHAAGTPFVLPSSESTSGPTAGPMVDKPSDKAFVPVVTSLGYGIQEVNLTVGTLGAFVANPLADQMAQAAFQSNISDEPALTMSSDGNLIAEAALVPGSNSACDIALLNTASMTWSSHSIPVQTLEADLGYPTGAITAGCGGVAAVVGSTAYVEASVEPPQPTALSMETVYELLPVNVVTGEAGTAIVLPGNSSGSYCTSPLYPSVMAGGDIVVYCRVNGVVDVVDPTTNTVARTVSVPGGGLTEKSTGCGNWMVSAGSTQDTVWLATGSNVAIASQATSAVPVDVTTGTVGTAVPFGEAACLAGASSDGSQFFVANSSCTTSADFPTCSLYLYSNSSTSGASKWTVRLASGLPGASQALTFVG